MTDVNLLIGDFYTRNDVSDLMDRIARGYFLKLGQRDSLRRRLERKAQHERR